MRSLRDGGEPLEKDLDLLFLLGETDEEIRNLPLIFGKPIVPTRQSDNEEALSALDPAHNEQLPILDGRRPSYAHCR